MNEAKLSEAMILFEKCSPTFVALGDITRQRLIESLARAGTNGLDVASITATTALSRPAISHQLKVLKDAGLVLSLKKGTQVFYRLNIREKVETLKKFILVMEDLVNEAGLEV